MMETGLMMIELVMERWFTKMKVSTMVTGTINRTEKEMDYCYGLMEPVSMDK